MAEKWAAIILAGGRGSRLDGADKAGLSVNGKTLLEWAAQACAGADHIVVVGSVTGSIATSLVGPVGGVDLVEENPRFGGPARGLFNGLDAVSSRPDLICVLAVDMPHVSAASLARLRAAAASTDGAVLVDPSGHRQWAMALRRDRLLEVRPSGDAQRHALTMDTLLSRLNIVDVPAVGEEHRDIDTWADLREVDGA